MTFRPRQNRILAALEKNEIPLGMQINIIDPTIIEILAYTGFDFYCLDMEHSRVNNETMTHFMRAADAAGITSLVRVTENNPNLIRHAIEAGAQGVIVPHIETAEEARMTVESRYPPEGKAGVCRSIRSANYSVKGFEEYMEYSNKQTMLIPLIEDQNGVKNVEDIFAQLKPGLDAVGMGMADLAFSLLTEPGQKVDWQNPYLTEVFDKIMAVSKRTGVPIINMVRTPDDAKAAIAKGVKVLLYSMDVQLFYNLCTDFIRAVKE